MNGKVKIKTKSEIEIMKEGGRKLGRVKKMVRARIKPGVNAYEIEELATDLIEKEGGKPSFKMVPGYSWTTCVNVNDGLVHGIPRKDIVFKKDDIVSVDLGMYYKGFHTDTSTSVYLGKNKDKKHFLETGISALKKAIKKAQAGKKIRDISKEIEINLEKEGLSPVTALVGHGVGRELHEAPPIPGFTSNDKSQDIVIKEGFVIAIEVMYSAGSGEVVHDEDGWTIRTKDGKIAGFFEETVAVGAYGPIVLTT